MCSLVITIGRLLLLAMIPVVIILAVCDSAEAENWMDVVASVFFGVFFAGMFFYARRVLQ
ncbi:hypothetical protein Q31b_02880 [Novipirellula aureliae]|uniref:Uncharacterized protein n=1 Tax=Novipirellula aureliae TaxID=2527966 RepID=A0A5C6EB08_9BACT|nr:hypothetical protein Q31b_02880 [Novipirellula aureliae]